MVVENSVSVTVLLGIGFTFLSMIALMSWWFYRRHIRKTIRINFITSGGSITRITRKSEDITSLIEYKKGKYVFDEKCVITNNWRHEIFYFEDLTDPIKFDTDKKNITSKVSPENLKAIIETELIAKLFKKDIVTFDNVLLIITIIMVGVSLFFSIKGYSSGVNIADTPENVELMRTIIKSALTSGV